MLESLQIQEPASTHTVTWGDRDELGERLPAGEFLVQLHLSERTICRRVQLQMERAEETRS